MKRIIITVCLAILTVNVKSQDKGFEMVDKFKLNKVGIKVYFKDPLKILAKEYPDFDNLADKEKHDLLNGYLHNNILYVFQTTNKAGLTKSYLLKGDVRKPRTKYYFNLEVTTGDIFNLNEPYENRIEKTINKLNVGGSFFEHMFIFQTAEGKSVIGQGIKMWGYFIMVEPYSNIKKAVSNIIEKDIDNTIPEEILSKKKVEIAPLFEYQVCGIKMVKEREFTTVVYQYDSVGKVVNQYPRTEKDSQLYYSSIGSDLAGVTMFPYFASTDTIRKTGNENVLFVISSQKYLNFYLKDLKIFKKPGTGDVERIEGKLIIHGYGVKGASSHDELYVADFARQGACYLPTTIKFFPIDDADYKRPRIVIEIKYKFKE